jgi:hypothetical protein
MALKTTQQLLEEALALRDKAQARMNDMLDEGDLDLATKGRGQAVVAIYNAACGEVKRCEHILQAKAENDSSRGVIVFKVPEPSDAVRA